MAHYMQTAKAERTAEQSVKNIMASLKAGGQNAAWTEGKHKMLEHYLNGGK